MIRRIREIFTVPNLDDQNKNLTARLLSAILFSISGVAIFITFPLALIIPEGKTEIAIQGALTLIFSAFLFYLVQRGRVELAAWLTVGLFWALNMVVVWADGGVKAEAYTSLILIIITAALLLGARAGIAFATLSALFGYLTVVAENNGWLAQTVIIQPSFVHWFGDVGVFALTALLLGFAVNNTKQTVQQLSESEARFRSLVERMMDGVYRSTHAGRFVEVNPAMIKMFGFSSREEMLEVDIKRELYFAPEERGSHVLDTGREEMDIYRMRRKDGSEIWVEDHGSYVHDERGEIIYHEGMLRDITERKRAEAELKQSEQNYRALYETARKQTQELALLGNVRNAMADELDLPVLLRNVVESIAASFGYAQVSLYLLNEDSLILQHQVGYDSVISKISITEGVSGRVIRTGEPVFLEDVRNDPDFLGAIKGIVSEICLPLFDAGQVAGILNVESTKNVKLGEDDLKLLTALSWHIGIAIGRARLYETVQQRNRILSALEQSTLVLMKKLDLTDVLQTILSQAAQLLDTSGGYIYIVDPDEKNITVTVALDHFAQHIGNKLQPNEGLAGKVWQSGQPINVSDYHSWISRSTQYNDSPFYAVVGVPLRSEDRVIGVLGLAHIELGPIFSPEDVELLTRFAQLASIALENARLHTLSQQELVERKQAEIEREKLIAELSTKNTELDGFAYTVSHDLKAPLVTINGFLGFLEKDAAAGDVQRMKKDSAHIHNAVSKMQRLLNELLELSRIGRMMNAPETIAFEDLIRDAMDVVRGRLESRGVTVKLSPPIGTQPKLPAIYGDRQRLTQVLQNLIDNAVKYMGDQSEPQIEIGQRGLEGDHPVFFVKDNGMGIAPEYHERIFGLFNKLDPNAEGTGVGLSIVRKIIEVHGGRIWVESEAGMGSTFLFTLPFAGQLAASNQ